MLINQFSKDYQYLFNVERLLVDDQQSVFSLPVCTDKLNIFDLSQNYEEPRIILNLDSILKNSRLPYLILSPDPAYNTNTIKYYPYFCLYGIKHWKKYSMLNFDQEKIYQFSCLNRKPHTHRIYNYFQLKKLNFNLSCTSFNKDDFSERIFDKDIDPEIINWYNHQVPNLPECDNDLGINHSAYSQSYINVVTETMVRDTVFISEKTWKPVASGQLFLMLGCRGTVDYLRNIGVDVFDDIVDHGYDFESNWVKRVDLMHISLQKLLSQNLKDLYDYTKKRRQDNINKFFSGVFSNRYNTIIQDIIRKENEKVQHTSNT